MIFTITINDHEDGSRFKVKKYYTFSQFTIYDSRFPASNACIVRATLEVP
jgi:hypothetical protein